jgi:amino acid adenylation domain-containing protein
MPAVIRLDLDPQAGTVAQGHSHQVAGGLLIDPRPGDAAYIFFTSGTTGIPKGIVGCHKGLSHFLSWQRTEFAIGPADRVAQLTALSFDVVLRDVFLPLTSGGTICLPESSETVRGVGLFPWLQRERISVLHAVPALADFWLDQSASECGLPALRYVFFAGEPLTDVLIGRWRQAVSSRSSIVNLYGPTETTLAKCFYRVPPVPLPGVQPIGRPLPQSQALVLSETNRLCGMGETGEIVLRTPFRTLGFLRPAATPGFSKNPFRDDETDRLYFTGDRGRYRPDGALEILGRLDDQIKIHGIRVEPAEIGAILTGHPGVRSCVVLPRVRKDTQVAVYVVLEEQSTVSVAQLRSYLAERFPITAGSVSITVLRTIPLTANGKVDRAALPAPDERRSDPAEADARPRTPLEARLAEIWESLLDVDQVGIHDNFFALGGHSLLATQLAVRVRKELHVELPLRSIFEMPTIESLALHVLAQQAATGRCEDLKAMLDELEATSEKVIEVQLREVV